MRFKCTEQQRIDGKLVQGEQRSFQQTAEALEVVRQPHDFVQFYIFA
ncbi:hypothetical protein CRENPOLYSF2_2050002 [Crenothrix polyspora]|uniref:Uncharacterized protein n=1 Tax=Crenothrix polyspora TaxID=360316 RepID=A0A1R4H5K2_9GAMM|nr:hypothetical protein CRENPOLYSF2_2050002 [Crenothrix polyspora]